MDGADRLARHPNLIEPTGPIAPTGEQIELAYDTGSKKVTQLIQNNGLDIKSASDGPGAIVYEQFGSLHLYDLKSGKTGQTEQEGPGGRRRAVFSLNAPEKGVAGED